MDCVLDESLAVRRHVWFADWLRTLWQRSEDVARVLQPGRSLATGFCLENDPVQRLASGRRRFCPTPLFQRRKFEAFIVVVHVNAKKQMGHVMATFRSDDAATQQLFLDSAVLDDGPNFGLDG